MTSSNPPEGFYSCFLAESFCVCFNFEIAHPLLYDKNRHDVFPASVLQPHEVVLSDNTILHLIVDANRNGIVRR